MKGWRARWWNRRMQNSPAPVDTSKIQLHVEQFTVKLTGDWQEDGHTTKAVRKIHAAQSGGKGRETVRLGPAVLGECQRQMGGDSPWKWVIQAQTGTLALGSNMGRTSPRAGGANRRPAESQDSSREEDMATSLLPKQGRDGGSRRHTAAPQPAPAWDRWELQRLASQPALHGAGGCQGSGRRLSRETTCDSGLMWHLSRAGAAVTGSSIGGTSESSLGLWPQPDCYRPWPNSRQGPTPALLVRHCLPIGWGEWCQDGRENTLTGDETSSDPVLKASAPVTWDPSWPLTGWWWPRERQEDLAHTRLQPEPLQLKRTSYQAYSCQHNPGEDVTQDHSRFSSLAKATGHSPNEDAPI